MPVPRNNALESASLCKTVASRRGTPARLLALVGGMLAFPTGIAFAQNTPVVIGWGSNGAGQISTPPLDVSRVMQISCGSVHTYALLDDGTVMGWGSNSDGQIETPVGANGVTQIACGQWFTYVLRTDGSVLGWGNNAEGQISTPTNLTGITQIACGAWHTYAVRNDGTVLGWGASIDGQTSTPANLSGVARVACGQDFTYALRSDGTLVGWGSNAYGQTETPSDATNVTQVACGALHTYALKGDGTLIGWGWNHFGQVDTPGNAIGVLQIAAGSSLTCALRESGTVVAWGSDTAGQTSPPIDLIGVNQIACGGSHSYAIGEIAEDADGDGYSFLRDCDDGNPDVYPGAYEFSDGLDNNCNGIVDDWDDHDGDGFQAAGDCNDSDPTMYPGAPELCDGKDNDCDGMIDGPCAIGGPCYDPTRCDADGDGTVDASDCDPQDSRTYPGATEWCDGKDNDCDGSVDDACIEDCNRDGIADADQIAANPIYDLDLDGRIDACQIRDDPSLDCNQNQILDSFELAYASDFRVTDCNVNGRIDSCDLADDPSLDCDGSHVFDACEIRDGDVEDCDSDGVPDGCAQYGKVDMASARLSPFGFTRPQTWTVDPALPGVDGAFESVTLDMRVRGDFASAGEYFTVIINGRFAGHVNGGGSADCNGYLDRGLLIPMNVWNYAASAGGGMVAIEFVPSIAVDTNRCPAVSPSYIEATLRYTAALDADCNANGLLDICEIEIAPWIDMNSNGIPDECEGNGTISTGCPGDLDRSGEVDPGDIALLLLEMNTPAAPGDPLDVDQSGMVDPGDVGFMLLLFGPCS
jgi:hypothetical protein